MIPLHRLLGAFAILKLSLLLVDIAEAQDAAVEKVKSLSWHTDEASAKTAAAETNKPIFLYFTADWCHYCHKMEKETLSTQKVSEYLNKNFVLFKVDYDNHKDLVARYRLRGVPASVLGDVELANSSQTSGFMPVEDFLTWVKKAEGEISPEVMAAQKAAIEEYVIETRRNFRTGLIADQYQSIRDFFKDCGEKEPHAIHFAKNHLIEEIKYQPDRFSRFLKHEKLHVRILMTNAFAKIYGSEFTFDPWDKSPENDQVLTAFLESKDITSLLEDLIDF